MHIMLDLETWGTRPGCDIRSIGAVVFDPVAGTVGNGYVCDDGPHIVRGYDFYIATDNPPVWDLQYKYDLHRDPETVKWWSEQSEESQAAFENPVDLREACERFAIWIETVNTEKPVPIYRALSTVTNLRLWANDPHFDVSILEAVFHEVGLPVPWHYRSPRSMKTVLDISGMTREEMKAFEYGEKHNALDDAISQAMIVCECYRRIRK